MVYRFDEHGHGEVFSEEQRRPGWRPSSATATRPPTSRRSRGGSTSATASACSSTSNTSPMPLVPRLSPVTGQDLDMSLCFLRSMSPIHIQYLKNMGVGATLVVSLMVGGRLWGLVACHHYAPRFVHFEMRAVCELLAEVARHPHRRPGELRAGPGGAGGAPARAAHDRGHLRARATGAARCSTARSRSCSRSAPAGRRCCSKTRC